MVNFVRLILIPQLGSSVAGFFGRFLGSEGTAIMTTPEFLLPLFVLVLILTIIYRILLSKKKKEFSSIIPNLYFSFLFMLSLSLLHFRKDCSFFRSDNSLIHFDFECFLFWIEFECPFRRRIRGNKSSSRPESSSGSTSLENHASSSENTEKDYFPPSSQFSSPSTSTSTPENQSIDSSPNTEQKESLDFLSDKLRSFWKTEIIRAVHERLAEIDPQGNIGRIRDGEIVDALRLDSPLRTRQEMEDIFKNVWKRPWPSYEEADRTSIYPRIWDLLEKNKRPDI